MMRAIRVICDAGVCFATDVCNIDFNDLPLIALNALSTFRYRVCVLANLTVAYL